MSRKKKVRHSYHAVERVRQRTNATIRDIEERIRGHQYATIEKITNNKRLILVAVNREFIVAVWSKAANFIITTWDLASYVATHPQLPDHVFQFINRKEQEWASSKEPVSWSVLSSRFSR